MGIGVGNQRESPQGNHTEEWLPFWLRAHEAIWRGGKVQARTGRSGQTRVRNWDKCIPLNHRMQTESLNLNSLQRERSPSPGPGTPVVREVLGVEALEEDMTELVPMITFTLQLPC